MAVRAIVLGFVVLVGTGCATASGPAPEAYQVFEGTVGGADPITLVTLPDGTARIAVKGVCGEEDGASTLTAFFSLPAEDFDADATIETGCVGDLEAGVDFKISGRIDGDRASGSISEHIAWNDEFESWEQDIGPNEWTADLRPDVTLPNVETFELTEVDGRSLAAGGDAAWLIDDENLTRIADDAADVERVGRARFLTRMFVSDDAVWFVDDAAGELVRHDPESGDEVARIGLDEYSNVALPEIAVAGDVVWVAEDADDVVWKIDPATNAVADKIELPFSRIDDLVATESAAWIVTVDEAKDALLVPLDADSGAIGETIPLPAGVDGFGLAESGSNAVILELGRGDLIRVDTETGDITEPTSAEYSAIDADGDSLWLLDAGTDMPRGLTRVDARTGESLETLMVPAIGAIAAHGDDIWILNGIEDTVTRVERPPS